MNSILWIRFVLLASLIIGTAQAEVAIPTLTHRVTDLTATLDAIQTQALEAKLSAFEVSKGAQIAVLMLSTTQPETIEQFSLRVVEAWKIGRKGVDDGVLLIIAKDDRKLRIEVGYGLEGALNDASAKRIVSEVISPLFKQGDFYAGIDAGVSSLMKVIEDEALPPPVQNAQSFAGDGEKIGNLLLLGFFMVIAGNAFLRPLFGRLPSGLIVGGLLGGIAWSMLFAIGFVVLVGIVAFVISLLFGASRGGGGNTPSSWGGGGNWSSGGGSSSWGGGGGDFGGGGASGDW